MDSLMQSSLTNDKVNTIVLSFRTDSLSDIFSAILRNLIMVAMYTVAGRQVGSHYVRSFLTSPSYLHSLSPLNPGSVLSNG